MSGEILYSVATWWSSTTPAPVAAAVDGVSLDIHRGRSSAGRGVRLQEVDPRKAMMRLPRNARIAKGELLFDSGT